MLSPYNLISLIFCIFIYIFLEKNNQNPLVLEIKMCPVCRAGIYSRARWWFEPDLMRVLSPFWDSWAGADEPRGRNFGWRSSGSSMTPTWTVLLFLLGLVCCFRTFRLLSSRNRLCCELWWLVLVHLNKKFLIQTEPHSSEFQLLFHSGLLGTFSTALQTFVWPQGVTLPLNIQCPVTAFVPDNGTGHRTGDLRAQESAKTRAWWVKPFKISFFHWDSWE